MQFATLCLQSAAYCNRHLLNHLPHKYILSGTCSGINIFSNAEYLCIVQFLNDVAILLTDITNTHKISLTMTSKKPLSNSAHYSKSRFPTWHRTVLNVPEYPNRGKTFSHRLSLFCWNRNKTKTAQRLYSYHSIKHHGIKIMCHQQLPSLL